MEAIIVFLSLNRLSRISVKYEGMINVTSAFRLLTVALTSPICNVQTHLSTHTDKTISLFPELAASRFSWRPSKDLIP